VIILLNVLNGITIALTFLLQVLLVRMFGASLETDIFYLTVAIVQFAQAFVSGMFVDVFVPLYNEERTKGSSGAARFAGATLVLAALASTAIAALMVGSSNTLVTLFAGAFSSGKVDAAGRLLAILSLSVPFATTALVLDSILTANLIVRPHYWMTMMTPLFGVLAVWLLMPRYGLEAVVYALLIASVVNAVWLAAMATRKVGFTLVNPFRSPEVFRLVRQNTPIRLGTFVYMLKGPITTNILSFLPTGSITLFNYADKMFQALVGATTAPLFQYLYLKGSSLFTRLATTELKELLATSVSSSLALMLVAVVATSMFFKPVFSFLLGPKVTADELSLLFVLFVSLAPAYVMVTLTTPFETLTLVFKQGLRILRVHVGFVLLYGFFVVSGFSTLGMFAIPLALCLAQLHNAMMFGSSVRDRLRGFEDSGDPMHRTGRAILRSVLLLIAFVATNVMLREDYVAIALFNLALVFTWLMLERTTVRSAFAFLTRRGEVQ
jgi:peptidoglycan biosynthesis protein MviN/MurJ (putative lipid II flippase)